LEVMEVKTLKYLKHGKGLSRVVFSCSSSSSSSIFSNERKTA
jgi:hypothetical protein